MLLSLLMALLLVIDLFSVRVMAASGKCGEKLTWTLSDAGVLTISGTGDMWDYDEEDPGWYEYRSEITSVVIEAGVTSIGIFAFAECEAVTEVTIPDSVTWIGAFAFFDCSSLPVVLISDSVDFIDYGAFAGCSSLTEINVYTGNHEYWSSEGILYCRDDYGIHTFPAGRGGEFEIEAYSICPFAFYDCTLLTAVEINNSESRIGDYAFFGCTSLKSIDIYESCAGIGEYGFYGCTSLTNLTIPAGVEDIGEYAFALCDSLSEIRFEGHAPAFSENVFYGVTATANYHQLDSWTTDIMQDYGGSINWVCDNNQCGDQVTWKLKGSVLTISGTGPMWDFKDNKPGYHGLRNSIASIIINRGVTSVGAYAFSEFSDSTLTSVRIPNSVRSIGDYAFFECRSLTGVTIPNGVKTIGNGAFSGCGGIKKISIPDSVVSIGASAFYLCSNLENLTLPLGVVFIGAHAFEYCNSIDNIIIPAGMESIEESSFRSCASLKSVTIPHGVKYIKDYAFSCGLLNSVTIPASVESIGKLSFWADSFLKVISFLGPAPAIEDNAFSSVTATAYYPAGDNTWTKSVRQNYGGKLTWHSYEPISLNKTNLKLAVGKSSTLSAKNSEGTAVKPTWTSSNETAATVSSGGKVSAKSVGKTIITATYNNYPVSCEVQVLFTDVTKTSQYYYKPVYWAADNSITKGYSDGSFGVDLNCQRKDLLIFLWRYAGEPTGYGDARKMFSDLSDYNTSTAANKAIAWAYKEGITKGYVENGKRYFHPTDSIVRKDVMILLYRLACKPDVSGTLAFPDCQEYAPTSDTYKAILWGSENGITKGYTSGEYEGQFGALLDCKREQIVTFLYRYHGLE